MSTNTAIKTPRVEACIDAVMLRFPSQKSTAYYEAVHQALAPLARTLEVEIAELRAALQAAQPAAQQGDGVLASHLAVLAGQIGASGIATRADAELVKRAANIIAQRTGSGEAIRTEGYEAGYIAAMEGVDAEHAGSGEAKPTDISARLREYAGNPGYSHNDYADTMRAAAEEIERYYGGMLAWKKTASKKDADYNSERMARIDERIVARIAQPDSERDAALRDALSAWWKSKRPLGWSEQEHAEIMVSTALATLNMP